MRKYQNIILGSIVFLVSILFILYSSLNLSLFPTQETKWGDKCFYFRFIKDYMVIEKLPMKKDFISGIDICLANFESPGSHNEDVIFFTNSRYEMLYTYRFSSDQIPRMEFIPIKFKNKIFIGKNDSIYICLHSSNGTTDNHILCGINTADTLNHIDLANVTNEDLLAALKGPRNPIKGSLALKTYESDTGNFLWTKVVFIFFTLVISLFIVFFNKVKASIIKVRLSPEKSYLIIAGAGSLLMLIITPPFQFVDEDKHFYRAYQVSEGDIFQFQDIVPKSLPDLAANNFMQMYFGMFDKTSPNKIYSTINAKLEPEKHVKGTDAPSNVFFSYIPQAIGITIGKIFHAPPLILLYLARLFGLIFLIFVIFCAIRIIPFGKWLLFLLGVMPMTLALTASASYDGSTIGISFLVIAWLLKKITVKNELFTKWDFLRLGLLIFCLALCKPPYFIIGFLALLIPMDKIGGRKKFGLAVIITISAMILGSQFNSLKTIIEPLRNKYFLSASQQKILNQIPDRQPSATEKRFVDDNRPKNIDPKAQRTFILDHKVDFLNYFLKTIFVYCGYFYFKTFVGIFGWVTNPLPPWLVYTYLIILILTALINPKSVFSFPILKRISLFFTFIIGLSLIELGFYLSFNTVASHYIEGVQGRYFIPFAPLLFLFFYNGTIGNFLNRYFSPKKKELKKPISRTKKESIPAIVLSEEQFFTKFWAYIVICFSVIAILCSLYLVITKYYIILL